MPRTRKQTETTPKHIGLNGPAMGEVFTLAEAAAYLRLPEEEVVRLAQTQDLPGRLAGAEWGFLKTAIQQRLSTPLLKTSKEDQMALAGIWKDDPYVEEELKEIYRRRGRPMAEDET